MRRRAGCKSNMVVHTQLAGGNHKKRTFASSALPGTLSQHVQQWPPYSAILCCINARHADASGERFFHLTVPWWSVIIGYIIGLSTKSVAGRYVGMFLMTTGYAGKWYKMLWRDSKLKLLTRRLCTHPCVGSQCLSQTASQAFRRDSDSKWFR